MGAWMVGTDSPPSKTDSLHAAQLRLGARTLDAGHAMMGERTIANAVRCNAENVRWPPNRVNRQVLQQEKKIMKRPSRPDTLKVATGPRSEVGGQRRERKGEGRRKKEEGRVTRPLRYTILKTSLA